MRPPLWQLGLAYFAVWFVWGSAYLATRIAVETIPPSLVMGPRNLLGGIVLIGFAMAFRARPLDRRQLFGALGVGLMYFTVSHGLLATAQQRVPSGVAALIFALVPLWIVVIEWAVGRRSPSRSVILGLGLGLAGVLVLVAGRAIGRIDPVWGAVTVIAGMAWAVGSVVAAHVLPGTSAVRVSGTQLFAGGLALTLYGLISGDMAGFDASQVTLRSALGFAYLLIAGTFVSFVAFNWLMSREPASRVATYAFVNPAVAVLLGWLVADEALTGPILVAMALIVASVALIVLVRR